MQGPAPALPTPDPQGVMCEAADTDCRLGWDMITVYPVLYYLVWQVTPAAPDRCAPLCSPAHSHPLSLCTVSHRRPKAISPSRTDVVSRRGPLVCVVLPQALYILKTEVLCRGRRAPPPPNAGCVVSSTP